MDNVIAKIIDSPWIAAAMVLSFVVCNCFAWLRIRREDRKDYHRPHLKPDFSRPAVKRHHEF